MMFLNQLPIFNAVSGMHDTFQVNLGRFRDSIFLNVIGMPVAAGITAAGGLDGPAAYGLVIDQSRRP
jgi:hypothetical protein